MAPRQHRRGVGPTPRHRRYALALAAALLAAVLPSVSASPSRADAAGPATAKIGDRAKTLEFTGFVVDQAHLLTGRQIAELTGRLDRFQQATGHQFAVVTVPDLGGEDVSTFTIRLAKRWGVGRRGVNDGIVLLVAPKERRARIEIGRGLERILTDRRCARIMAEAIIPRFRNGKMAAGIDAGVTAIIAAFGGPPSPHRSPAARHP